MFKDLTRSEGQYKLKALMQTLNKLGNYNVKLSHHEDRPGNHHEDVAQISYRGQTKGRYNNNEEKSIYADTNQGLNEWKPKKSKELPARKDGLYDFLYHILTKLQRSGDENGDENNGSKKDCLKKVGKCTDLDWPPSNKTKVRTFDDNTQEIAEFLNELEKELGLTNINDIKNNIDYANNYNNKNRDTGDASNDNNERNNANYNQHLRCIGDKCSRRTDDVNYNNEDRYKNILRCNGASCSRSRLQLANDDVYEIDLLRCIGDRCSKFNSDDRDAIDSLRCMRDRCLSDDISESLRCVGNRCGRNRNIDSDSDADSGSDSNDADDEDDEYTDDDDDARMDPNVALAIAKLGLNNLRCSRNLCTYTDDSNSLRCIGNRCARERDEDTNSDEVNVIELDGLRCIDNRCDRDRENEDDSRNTVRCSEDRCDRDRVEGEGDSSYSNAIVTEDELLGHVDTLITNVLAKNLRANSLLEDEDVQMLLKERKKIMKEVRKIVSQIHHE